MKRLFDLIIKINQILLFLALLGMIGGIIFIIYQLKSEHYQPPQVAVAQTSEGEKKTAVEDVRFLGESGDIYVFGIVKREVAKYEQTGMRMINSLSDRDNEGQIVNVVFSKGSKRVKTLLKDEGLVIENNLYDRYNYSDTNFTPYLFMCVTEDTDGNLVLDGRDREDLYIVARDLNKPDMVIKGASSFNVVSATHLLVKTGTGDAVHFMDVDTERQTQKEIEWK